jgi:hypothetical protein
VIGTPLFLGTLEREALALLRGKAAEKPVSMIGIEQRLKDPAEKARHMAHMTAQTIDIPAAYQVTFSIETGHPAGMARHMSMSVQRNGRVPNQHAVWMVAELLGFVGSLDECMCWIEDLKDHGRAVNVVQPVDVHAGGNA